jgi:hypothetical protein
MANWKKIIVSGSNAELISLQSDELVQIGSNQFISSSVADTKLSGSFSGSFEGDGSGLTGLVTTLSGSTDSGDFEVDLLTQTLTVQGTANEIEVSGSGQTITIGLPENVTIGQNLIVGGDLTVNGETTVINTTNVVIEDKFVLYASGSTQPTDGGIVIQSGISNGDVLGFAYGYDSDKTRWAFQSDFDHTISAFITPDSFATTTQFGLNNTRPVNPQYGGSSNGYGNIWVSTDTGEIYMWA